MGARSVILFASSGLFLVDLKKESLTASVERINNSKLDAVYITDTYQHSLTNPEIQQAIAQSPIIHVIKTAPYLSSIVRALHVERAEEMEPEQNSVLALLKGTHPDQTREGQTLSIPVPTKAGSPLLRLGRSP